MHIWAALLLAALVAVVQAEPYEELRIYDIVPGKMEGTLERFRDHIAKLFVKHGLKPVAFWAGKEGEKEVFAYILRSGSEAEFKAGSKNFGEDAEFKKAYSDSTQKHGNTVAKLESFPLQSISWTEQVVTGEIRKAKAVELRVYTIEPGKTDVYLESYRQSRCEVFARHGLSNLGYWKSRDKEGRELLVMLLGQESIDGIKKAKEAYHQDRAWAAEMKRLEPEGKLTMGVRSLLLTPTDFSKGIE